MNKVGSCTLFAVTAVVIACAPAAPTTTPAPAEARERGFPGFDISTYPGDATMRAWRRPGSPYHWVGYYLPAPCRRDTSWAGRRAALESMGWGTAVLYVGQQTWDNVPDARTARDTAAADSVAGIRDTLAIPDTGAVRTDTLVTADTAATIICSRTLLSAEQGRAEGDDAIARAAAEGFPRGTAIFLNIERMERITQPMRDYFRAWAERLLEDGRYRPGVYSHHRNAADIHADVREVYATAGATGAPPFWVADPRSFALVAAPMEAGLPFATIWQGALDVRRTWSGVTLTVDENVASTPNPSAPPAMFPGDSRTEGECGTGSCTRVATTGTSRR